jgi:K+-sensing histidine kinase KdpD
MVNPARRKMSILKKKGIAVATTVYWFLLVYIIAALVWWFIALQQQNRQMTLHRQLELKADDPAYLQKSGAITNEESRKNAQYIGEGVTFLLVILVGAVFVYRAVRRQLKLSQQQQNFMMAVTHELKTPIAVAKLNLETLQKHKLGEDKQQKLIKATLQEAERLNNLANNILISSQLEGGAYKVTKETLDLSSLVNNYISDFRHRFPDRKFNAAVMNDIKISGDTILLQILINNLIENAMKYSPADAPINIALSKKGDMVKLSITDEGPGIPEGEKKKIFDRFYRIGNEQVRKTRGTGLGLYLCKKIAIDHHATIQVTNNDPSGSIFTVQFRL